MASSTVEMTPERQKALEEDLRRLDLHGHWQGWGEHPDQKPQVWRWADIRRCLVESGNVIPVGQDVLTDRRTLVLKTRAATFSMAFQMLLPGESAQAHRHNFSAIRFVVEGGGAYSTADGEQMLMEPGDLLTQPNFAWHDHNNRVDEPCIWVDGVEARLSSLFQAAFHDTWVEGVSQPIAKSDGYSRRVLGPVRQKTELARGIHPPGFSYKWGDTIQTLEELAAEGQGDPYDGVLLEYNNPITGGHTFPVMTCYIQMLRPGETTRRHRHTGSQLHHVVRGQGVTFVDKSVDPPTDFNEPAHAAAAAELDWGEKDTFIVPSWRWHRHRNSSNSEPVILFSLSDRPILEAAGMYWEEGE